VIAPPSVLTSEQLVLGDVALAGLVYALAMAGVCACAVPDSTVKTMTKRMMRFTDRKFDNMKTSIAQSF
jgi:hypothetical protein